MKIKKNSITSKLTINYYSSSVFNTPEILTFDEINYQNQINVKIEQNSIVNSYFGTYSNYGIHESMIKDKIRTESYKLAIEKNKKLFENKIVLDVGCGTGILSYFCVSAGAKHVYAVDAADIADFTKNIVKDNKLENKITVIKGKIEEITLPVDHVDIIVSEWMGYFLLFESMLDSVLYARDKWLINDGLIFPDRFCINICSAQDDYFIKNSIDFWNNVYGVNMSSIKNWALSEPMISFCMENNINSTICKIFEINLNTASINDFEFQSFYKIKLIKPTTVNMLVSWFDVFFENKLLEKVSFTTGPFNTPTHWKQTLFYLNSELFTEEDDIISGNIAIFKSKSNFRELDIVLSINLSKNEKSNVFISKQYYKLK